MPRRRCPTRAVKPDSELPVPPPITRAVSAAYLCASSSRNTCADTEYQAVAALAAAAASAVPVPVGDDALASSSSEPGRGPILCVSAVKSALNDVLPVREIRL